MMKEPVAWMYDWDGACAPGGAASGAYHTFSVGIFQWQPKAGGKGLKRSRVLTRIRGLIVKPEEVYHEAQEICDKLNAVKGTARPRRPNETRSVVVRGNAERCEDAVDRIQNKVHGG